MNLTFGDFEELVSNVHEGSVVDFEEYTLDRHMNKRLTMSIEGAVVYRVFPANETLSREVLEEYYGTELEDEDYLQLATMNCPRLVLNLGVNQYNEINIKIIILNYDFFRSGLQKLTVTNELDPKQIEEPSYLMAQKGW